MTALDALLRDWLPGQRWYGGKGTAIRAVRVGSETRLPGDADVRLTLLEVDGEDGSTERYQLLVGRRTGELEPRLEHAVIGEVDGAVAYDAVHDHDAMSSLLRLLAQGGEVGPLVFTNDGEVDATLQSRVMSAEQSNTSVVFGDDKVFCVNNLSRFPQPVELDLQRFEGCVPVELTGGVHFPRIGELPYLLSLPGHGFLWFAVRKEDDL